LFWGREALDALQDDRRAGVIANGEVLDDHGGLWGSPDLEGDQQWGWN
jgi:hypothetical protein